MLLAVIVFNGSNLVLKFYLDMQLGHFWIAIIMPDKIRPLGPKKSEYFNLKFTKYETWWKKVVMNIGQNHPEICALTGIASFKGV